MRVQLITRGAAKRLGVLAGLIVVLLAVAWWTMIRMPGSSHTGPLPTMTEAETELAARLKDDIETLAGKIGVRNRFTLKAYQEAANHIEARLGEAGLEPQRQACPPRQPGLTPGNIWCEVRGSTSPERIIVVGAHYDSYADSPGADDNGSGVAAVLALAERLAKAAPKKTLRFCLFADEEPPQFQTEEMGSLVFARWCQEKGESIDAMISIETIGWYRDEPNSQKYPRPLNLAYPNEGNFIGLVSDVRSRALLRDVIGTFRSTTAFPSEGGALPAALPGISWSDHWAFWQTGVPALMVTDTAPFRYPHYHTPEDTPDKIDTDRMARVVVGLERVLRHLADQ